MSERKEIADCTNLAGDSYQHVDADRQLATLRAENEAAARERELHLAEIVMLKKEVERQKAYRHHDANALKFSDGVAERKHKELQEALADNEALRHDLSRLVQRETDLIAENEALRAAMAEWQERAIAFVRGRYAGRAEGSDVWLEIGKIVRGIERLTAPTLDRGREIVRDAERYRWLRGNERANAIKVAIECRLLPAGNKFEALDDAIDAAREAKHG